MCVHVCGLFTEGGGLFTEEGEVYLQRKRGMGSIYCVGKVYLTCVCVWVSFHFTV